MSSSVARRPARLALLLLVAIALAALAVAVTTQSSPRTTSHGFLTPAEAVNQANAIFISATGVKQGAFKTEVVQCPSTGGCAHLISINLGVTSPRDPASGLPTGKRQWKPIVVTKEFGAASLQYLQAAIVNETLTKVTFDFAKTSEDGKLTVFYRIKLTNGDVASFDQTADASTNNLPREQISLTFQKIEFDNLETKQTVSDDFVAGPA